MTGWNCDKSRVLRYLADGTRIARDKFDLPVVQMKLFQQTATRSLELRGKAASISGVRFVLLALSVLMAPMISQAQTGSLFGVRSSLARIRTTTELDVLEAGNSVAWGFTPSTDILVTALGTMGDPLSDSPRSFITEGLFDSTGRQLASVDFGNGGTLINGSLFQEISSVRLAAGRRYVIGFQLTGYDLTYASRNEVFVDPNIRFLDSQVTMGGGPFYSANRTNIFNTMAFGANFQFSIVNGSGVVIAPEIDVWDPPSSGGKRGRLQSIEMPAGNIDIWDSSASMGKGGSLWVADSVVVVPEPAYLSLVLLGLATFFAIKVRGRDA
jgi:hypothetical protein